MIEGNPSADLRYDLNPKLMVISFCKVFWVMFLATKCNDYQFSLSCDHTSTYFPNLSVLDYHDFEIHLWLLLSLRLSYLSDVAYCTTSLYDIIPQPSVNLRPKLKDLAVSTHHFITLLPSYAHIIPFTLFHFHAVSFHSRCAHYAATINHTLFYSSLLILITSESLLRLYQESRAVILCVKAVNPLCQGRKFTVLRLLLKPCNLLFHKVLEQSREFTVLRPLLKPCFRTEP